MSESIMRRTEGKMSGAALTEARRDRVVRTVTATILTGDIRILRRPQARREWAVRGDSRREDIPLRKRRSSRNW